MSTEKARDAFRQWMDKTSYIKISFPDGAADRALRELAEIIALIPPFEPPLPWLAIDLQRIGEELAMREYDVECCGELLGEAKEKIATLTAQLAEARGLLAKCGIVLNDAPQPARNEVATLKAMIRLTVLRWVPAITHEQIDAHIDAALAGKAAAIESLASQDVVRVKWVDVTAGHIQEHALYFGNAQVGCIRRLLYDQWRAYAGKREFGKFEGEYAAKAALLAALNGGE